MTDELNPKNSHPDETTLQDEVTSDTLNPTDAPENDTPYASLSTPTPEPTYVKAFIVPDELGELDEPDDTTADEVDEADEEAFEEKPRIASRVAAIGKAIVDGVLPERYRKALANRHQEAFDPSFYEDDDLTEEEEPIPFNGFNPTTTQSMPIIDDYWDEEPVVDEEPAPTRKPSHIGLAAAFVAVALVSFAAGGITSSLSMRPFIPTNQESKPTESTASLTQPAKPVHTLDQQEPTDDSKGLQEPELDTSTQPEETYQQDRIVSDTTDNTPQKETNEQDNTLTYNTDTQQQDTDRDDRTYAFDIDDLYDLYDYYTYLDDGYGYTYQNDTSNGYGDNRTDPYDSYIYDYLREYGYGTGYDTEEDRDYYSWNNQRTTSHGYLT